MTGLHGCSSPILQGQQTIRNNITRNDLAFRPALSHLRQRWEQAVGLAHPSDGFLLINELRMPRKQATYSPYLWQAYQRSLAAMVKTLEMPIRYAGPGDWSVFEEPLAYAHLRDRTVAVPDAQPQDKCLVITADLWQTFRDMSLWVEALCIHEWCLFTERVNQTQANINRGDIYTLLTARPDNRRPLTWEANNIDLLLLEGHAFICPWTAKRIASGSPYDLDHLLPISVYPINELWNLIPADPTFNRHTKRDRLPTLEVLKRAEPRLEHDYKCYSLSITLAQALQDDVNLRFSTLHCAGKSTFSERWQVLLLIRLSKWQSHGTLVGSSQWTCL